MSSRSPFVPAHKGDREAVDRAIAAGFPAVESVLPALLGCILDANWPIAVRIWPFLVSIGAPLVPHIRTVFEGEDDLWKYWCVALVSDMAPEVQRSLLPDLERLAQRPTPGEEHEEVTQEVRELLERIQR